MTVLMGLYSVGSCSVARAPIVSYRTLPSLALFPSMLVVARSCPKARPRCITAPPSAGNDPREQLAEETSSYVSEIADVDRTGELLAWVFESMFAPKVQQHKHEAELVSQGPTELAVLGAGCFWCPQAVLSQLKGVTGVTCGYAGGSTPNPTYKQLCRWLLV